MKRLIFSLVMLLMPLAVSAQNTYTTTADGCGGKNLGYCLLPVNDQGGNPFQLVLDHRNNSQGPIDTMTVQAPDYPHAQMLSVHGAYAGFVGPTDNHTPFFSSGSFASDATTVDSNGNTIPQVQGQFNYYAYYVPSCSGRGCGGTVIGWHFKVLTGSTVAVQ
jgi:hypothetical protein